MASTKRLRLSLTKQRKLAVLDQHVSDDATCVENSNSSCPVPKNPISNNAQESSSEQKLNISDPLPKVLSEICSEDSQEPPQRSKLKTFLESGSPRSILSEYKNDVRNFANQELDHSTPAIKMLGLPNIGNTCFMNAILQVLRFTPEFLPFIHLLNKNIVKKNSVEVIFNLNTGQKIAHYLHNLYKHMRTVEVDAGLSEIKNDKSLKKCLEYLLDVMSEAFIVGQQCDAHEFFLWLLKGLKSASAALGVCKPLTEEQLHKLRVRNRWKRRNPWCTSKRRSNNSPKKLQQEKMTPSLLDITKSNCCLGKQGGLMSQYISLMFEGDVKYSLCCLECETVKDQLEKYIDIEVPIRRRDDSDEETQNSTDFLGFLKHSSKLQNDDKYWCDTCIHLTEARQMMQIVSIPTILIFRTRFTMSNRINFQDKGYVHTSIPTNLACFAEECSIRGTQKKRTFCLYSMVLHVGTSITSGHYLSLVKASSLQCANCQHDSDNCKYKLCNEKQTSPGTTKKLPNNATNGNLNGSSLCQTCCFYTHNIMGNVHSTDWICFDDDKVSVFSDSEVLSFCSDGNLNRIRAATPYLLLYR